MGEPLLDMRNISKSFPGVQALSRVNFSIRQGEIVCLLGENGAGKSTLMKVLTGVYGDYEGEVVLDGRRVRFGSTREAFEHGISIVFQEFNLCPNLSAMENLFLGHEMRNRLGLLSYGRMRRESRAAFANLRAEIDPEAMVRDLGVAQQQMIEVAKALSHRTRILIMDEPTSALAEAEIRNLFEIMRELRRGGMSIVFISHKLNEVLEICDRVVCLKDGGNSGEIATKVASEDDLVAMMIGREIGQMYARRRGGAGEQVVLEVRDLCGGPMIRNVSFSLRRGEIVGLAGLIGAGRTELARLIVGAERKTGGEILLDGRRVRIDHPSDAVALGIGYASEDRKALGLVLPMTVRENVTLSVHGPSSTVPCRKFPPNNELWAQG